MRNNSPYFKLYQKQLHVVFKWWGFLKRKIRRQIVLVAYGESSFCAQSPRMVPKYWVHKHFVCVLPTRNCALKMTNKNLKFSFNLALNPLHKHHSKIRGNTGNKNSPSPDLCSGGYSFIFPFFPWLWWYIWIQLIKFQLWGSRLFAWYRITQNEIQCHNQIVTQWTGNFRLINIFRKRTK